MKNRISIFQVVAVCITMVIGLLGIIGLFTRSDLLQMGVSEAAKMKFNVAAGFILSSIVLLLSYFPGKNKIRDILSVSLSLLIALAGLFALVQYLSGSNQGIDEFFTRNLIRTNAVFYTGRMSPISAINFLLIGTGLLLLNKEKTAGYQFWYLSGIVFTALLMLVGLNFIADIPASVRLGIPVAIGFITLPAAVWFAQPMLRKKISFERKLVTGFISVILLIVMITLVSYYYNHKRVQTAYLVQHTNNVLAEAELTASFAKDIESGGRAYVITGDSSYLVDFETARKTVLDHVYTLKQLTIDNPSQQIRLDSLLSFVNARIDFSLRCIQVRNEKGFEAVNKLMATGTGKSYTDGIRKIVAEIQQEEKDLLNQREKENNKSIGSFNRAVFVFLAAVFVLLIIIFIFIRNNSIVRKKAEKQVREGEEQVQAIFTAAPDAVILIDQLGKIIKWNPRAEKFFGWKEEEVAGKLLSHVIIPDRFREAHTKGLKHFLRTGEGPLLGQIIETCALTKNNTEVDVALNIAVTPKIKGQHLFIGFVRDITGQRKAEIQIEKQTRDIQDFIDSMSTLCAKVATTGALLLVNKITMQASGLTMEELLKTNFMDGSWWTFDPAVHARVADAFKKACAGAAINYDENIFVFGQILTINFSLTPIFNKDNSVDYIVAEGRDITPQKKAEEEIRQLNTELEMRVSTRTDELYKSEKKYRYLFENNPMPMWVVDLDTFQFLDVNEAAMTHYGYSRDEFLSMTAFDIRPREEIERFRQADHSPKIRKGEYNRGTWRHRKKDGTIIHVEVIAHDINYEGKTARFILSNDITERVRTREELEKSIKEIADYRYALDESSIVAITDQKGIIKHANENFCRISKYSADELTGKDHRIVNSGYHSKEFIRDLWVTIANGKIWRGELKNKAKDGSIYWVDTTIVPFLNEEAKPYQYVAIRADITERKKAEQALHENQQLLSAIVDNSIAVIYVKDLQGRYLMVNRRYCELFHLNAGDILGKTDYDFFSKEKADAYRQMDERTAIADAPLTEEEMIPLDDGPHAYISVKSTLRDDKGKPYAIFGISTDITKLKLVEENLRKSLRETSDYKFALDESSIVAITDQKGIIKYVNDNFCKISKYSAVELVGQDHRIINSGYHSKEFIRDLWVTIANGKIWKGELKNKAKDGSIYWVDTTIIPFLNEEGKPYQYVAIRSDITARKNIESELQRFNEELEQKVTERTEELNTVNREMEAFTYSVSHDLRAPLRGIIGFATILEEDYISKLDEEAKRITSVIKTNTLKMGHLIDDLLAFSRMGRKEIAKTSVKTSILVKEVIKELDHGEDKTGIEWNIHSLPVVQADLTTIRQVWVNLISNAMKYSAKKKNPCIEIGTDKKDKDIIFFVKDNGVGFDMQYKDKLFRVFQRLHSAEEFEGTGVGLALVEKIVSRHGGHVWAEGEVNKGATFWFNLPAE